MGILLFILAAAVTWGEYVLSPWVAWALVGFYLMAHECKGSQSLANTTRSTPSASATAPTAGVRCAVPTFIPQSHKETAMGNDLLGTTFALAIVGIAYVVFYFVM